MEVNIRINGVKLDGVSAGAVKLNINNPDPFSFSDPTVSYTGSIEVPRSQVNDRVFRADRWPWMFTRTAPYTAELDFGGLSAPRGTNAYRAQVTVNPDSYSITLVESVTKLSSIQGGVIAKPYDEAQFGLWWANSYDSALAYAYNSQLTRPSLFNFGDVFVYPGYTAEKKETTASSFVGSVSQLAYRIGHDYLLGARYPTTDMIALDNNVACALERMTGSTFTLTFTQDCFVWLPASTASTVYLGSNRSTGNIAMTRDTSVLINANYKHKIAAGSSLVVQPVAGNSTLFHIRTTTATTSTKLTPATNVPTGEGYYFSFEITAVGAEAYSKMLAPDTGFTSAYDLVQAYCKAFFWTYDFRPSPFNIELKPYINTSAINIYRQNWTGKIDMDSVKIGEPSGIARTYKSTAGEAMCVVDGSVRSMQSQGQGAESSMPVSFGEPPFATMYHLTDGLPYKNSFYISASGYRARAEAHYKWFTPGWQVSAKMRLSYFDILNMTSDGLYFVGELNSWFYLRAIQNWNAADSTATCTLIAVNNS